MDRGWGYHNVLNDENMKLADALWTIQAADPALPAYSVYLVTGSTPEPLSRFLAAYLQKRLEQRRVIVHAGLFGDLAGNLARYFTSPHDSGAMLLEWADLDSRLGWRQPATWGRDVVGDVLESVQRRLDQLSSLIDKSNKLNPLVIVPPMLPIPPVIPMESCRLHLLEAELNARLLRFLILASAYSHIRVLSPNHLSEVSISKRIDLQSWWSAGVPYARAFASALARSTACAMIPDLPAKGLISDLDNTMWSGILGDVGVENVHWDLDHHAAIHGIYQQFLNSLMQDGALVAIASKNDRTLVDEMLRRGDLLLQTQSIFPCEVHWQSKAESAARILQVWNINPEAVVFVDDSPLEVASMQAAFPTMDCRVFPAEKPNDFREFLSDLASRFGKFERREEDLLRVQSIRAGAERANLAVPGQSQEDILKTSDGELNITRVIIPPHPRALELLNKTNQFNLNGVRYTESEWLHYIQAEGVVAWLATYQDKFAPLGKIAVFAGRRRDRRLDLDVWAMSCRAFSRRIEHAIMDFIFHQEGFAEIILRFRATDRNTPFREFLASLTCSRPKGDVSLAQTAFDAHKPALYMSVHTRS
jgi:FkbH-like protein